MRVLKNMPISSKKDVDLVRNNVKDAINDLIKYIEKIKNILDIYIGVYECILNFSELKNITDFQDESKTLNFVNKAKNYCDTLKK